MSIESFEGALALYTRDKNEKNKVEEAITQCVESNSHSSKELFLILKQYFDNELIDEIEFAAFAKLIRKSVIDEQASHANKEDRNEALHDADDSDRTVVYESTQHTTPTQTSASTWSKPFQESSTDESVGVGTVIKDRFKLVEFVGRGGMGDVYKAEDLRRIDAGDVESEVAIKLLNKDFKDHPESLRTLQREARKTQSLAHPHIVNVYDFDRDKSHVFMTMEFMHGKPLNEVIKKKKLGFEASLAKKLILELCEGLQYAHKKGVVHSDLKPSNIFLIKNTELKIFDFGIARAANIGQGKDTKADTFDAGLIGALTPSYASPEMLDENASASVKDDIYALGCIVYEILTGSHPFLKKGKKLPANVAMKEGLVPEKIKSLNNSQQIALNKCLAFDRKKRIKSVEEFKQTFFGTKSPFSAKNMAMGLTASVIAVGGIFLAINHQSNKEINELLSLIEDNESVALQQRLNEILRDDEENQIKIFENRKVEDSLKDYIEKKAIEHAENDAYSLALETLNLSKSIYPDSIEVDLLYKKIDEAQKARIIEIYAELDNILDSSANTLQHYQLLPLIIKKLRNVDNQNARLENSQPLFSLAEGIRDLLVKENYETALGMIEAGRLIISSSNAFSEFTPQFESFFERANELQLNDAKNKRVTELLTKLQVNSANNDLPGIDYQNDRAALIELFELAPGKDVVIALRAQVEAAFDSTLKEQFQQANWPEAANIAQQFEPLISKAKFNNALIQIENRRANFITDLTRQVRKIQDFADNDQPQKAQEIFSKLDVTQFGEKKILRLNNEIASSWLRIARKSAGVNLWDDANDAIEKGLLLNASSQVKDLFAKEKLAILDKQALIKKQSQEQERLVAEQAKQKKIDGYKNNILERLQEKDITLATLSVINESLIGLEKESANNPLLQSVPIQLNEKLTAHILEMGEEDVDGALQFANDAVEFLPNKASLNDTIAYLENKLKAQEDAKRVQRLRLQEQKIYSAIAAAKTLSDFTRIEKALNELANSEPERSQLNSVTSAMISRLIVFSDEFKNEARFVQAKNAVNWAKRLGADEQEIANYLEKINAAETQRENEIKRQRRDSKIQSLTQSLVAYLQASEFKNAERVKAQVMSMGNVPEATYKQIDKAFTDAYLDSSDKYYQQLDISNAEFWLQRAKNIAENDPRIAPLQSKYRAVKSILNAVDKNAELALKLKQSALEMFPNDSVIKAIEIELPTTNSAEDAVKGSGNAKLTITSTKVGTSSKSVACTRNMVGQGRRSTCRDEIKDELFGPYLIVLPKEQGENKHIAISKYEVRVGEYNAFCRQTVSCSPLSKDEMLPVTDITLKQIKAFTTWLSNSTDSTYRLPTVSEWRFAATANGKKPKFKNCTGDENGGSLKPVNYMKAEASNSWGFTHYLGNAQEVATVINGFALLGGHYKDDNAMCNTQFSRLVSGDVEKITGFRVVKELTL